MANKRGRLKKPTKSSILHEVFMENEIFQENVSIFADIFDLPIDDQN